MDVDGGFEKEGNYVSSASKERERERRQARVYLSFREKGERIDRSRSSNLKNTRRRGGAAVDQKKRKETLTHWLEGEMPSPDGSFREEKRVGDSRFRGRGGGCPDCLAAQKGEGVKEENPKSRQRRGKDSKERSLRIK